MTEYIDRNALLQKIRWASDAEEAVAWTLLFWAVLAVSMAGATLSEHIRAKKNSRR